MEDCVDEDHPCLQRTSGKFEEVKPSIDSTCPSGYKIHVDEEKGESDLEECSKDIKCTVPGEEGDSADSVDGGESVPGVTDIGNVNQSSVIVNENGNVPSEVNMFKKDDNVEFEVLHVQVGSNGRKSKRKNPPRRKVFRHHCYECGSSFDNEEEFKEHSETCNVRTDSESEIHVKIEVESDEEYSMSAKSSRTESDSEEKTIECDICQSKFKQINYLRQHQIKVHGWNLYPCSLCELSFHTARDCANHVKTHGQEKPYCCSVCGKRYVLRESLNRHYKVHDANKAYTCDICGKAFAEKISWTRHQHIHTGKHLIKHACTCTGKQKNDALYYID